MLSNREYVKRKLSFVSGNKKIAIYGTGNGGKEVYSVLSELGLLSNICCFVENNLSAKLGCYIDNIKICNFDAASKLVDVIVVAAQINHEEIHKRIKDAAEKLKIEIVDPYARENDFDGAIKYLSYIEEHAIGKSNDFEEINYETKYEREKRDSKLIAWYLPQYHNIEINDVYHGKGFTEWTNTSQAIPLFKGHYQPHIPYDLGYYNLLDSGVLHRQVELAKMFGIYGFCFHYYWFSGKRIMEKPLELFFKQKELDFPFCINWATETWTTCWDDYEGRVMFEQKYREGDAVHFMDDLLPLLKDERYIKIQGKPVICIYRCDVFLKECFLKMIKEFRLYAKRSGFPDLYIMISTATKNSEPASEWGGDAAVEFPPHRITADMHEIFPEGYVNPKFNGIIYDARTYCDEKLYLNRLFSGEKNYYRSVMLSYDNTARRPRTGAVFYGLNPDTYKEWLVDVLIESKQIHSESNDFVFINSWNEWAEGQHLEPDLKYGYAYLNRTKEALLECRTSC